MPTGTQNRQRVPGCTIGRLPASGSCTLSIVRKPGAPPRAYTLPCIRQTDIGISQRLHFQPTVRTGVICQPHSGPRSADRFRVSKLYCRFFAGQEQGEETGQARPLAGATRGQAEPDRRQTQPVGLGSPPYLVIGFIGPVIQSLNMPFWSSPRYLANLRMGGTTECSS